MDELSSAQYEAIGRLAISFNEIEWYVDRYLPVFMTEDEEIGEIIVNQFRSVSQKWSLLAQIVKHLKARHSRLSEKGEGLLKSINQLNEVPKRRNELVHAMVVKDVDSEVVTLQSMKIRVGVFASDAASISQAAEWAQKVGDELNEGCASFWREWIEITHPGK